MTWVGFGGDARQHPVQPPNRGPQSRFELVKTANHFHDGAMTQRSVSGNRSWGLKSESSFMTCGLRGAFYKNLSSPHFTSHLKPRRRISHAFSARSTRDLCSCLLLCLSSVAQEALCDQGCARVSALILDFRYVRRGSTWLLSFPPVGQ